MNAITLLTDDHTRVRKLFTRYEKLGERAATTKSRLSHEIIEELSIHAGIEEAVYYPRVRAAVPAVENQVLESLEEHHLAKTVLAELNRMTPADERFDAKMAVMMENVRHHMDEEEKAWFPKVRRALSTEELDELGEALDTARAIVPKLPHPHAPDAPPSNLVASALTVPLDMTVVLGRRVLGKVRPRVTSVLWRR